MQDGACLLGPGPAWKVFLFFHKPCLVLALLPMFQSRVLASVIDQQTVHSHLLGPWSVPQGSVVRITGHLVLGRLSLRTVSQGLDLVALGS